MKFSEFFKLNKTQAYLDFVDIPLHTDIAVFLDPVAIKSLNSVWGHELSSLLQTFFEAVLLHIKNSEHDKAIELLSGLAEGNEFHLGYSKGKSQGRGFGSESAELTWEALVKSKAAKSGLLEDLEDTALLIEGINTDKISDAVCNILRGPLIKYTQDMCKYYGVPLTQNVVSGRIWDANLKKWEDNYVDLPMTSEGKVILVPKILVRRDITYKYDSYYRDYLLPAMQEEHLQNNSSLVQVLKNKTRRVTKKDLMAKYGSNKLAVVEQTLKRPNVLKVYKEEKSKTVDSPMTQKEFQKIEEVESADLQKLIQDLKKLKAGKSNAERYEDIIEKILSVILYPSLCNPTKQHEIHEGRKRIDITYSNEAKNGFFAWISQHYPASLIFVECKNYTKDITNPEIDQLSSRFSPSRGKVGLQICRTFKNKELFYERCRDTAKDERGFVLVLDDNDIELLVNEYIATDGGQDFNLLKSQFMSLIS